MSTQPAIVAKFGGTSVATAAQLRKVKAIIDANPQRRLIVPSAPGKAHPKDTKVTDLLLLCWQLAKEHQDISPQWNQVRDRFLGIAKELGLSLPLDQVLAEVRTRIDAGTTRDYVASRGEAIHGHIVAALLDAEYVDAAEVIFFNRGGRLDEAKTYAAIAKRCADPDRRFVIPGFYGVAPSGEIKTFSRGGSDVTGAVVAAAAKAALYENWTDVSGVLMTDPRIIPEARTIAEITYSELRELAYMGASVLHEEAVFPASKAKIPINIRNTNRPEDPGTFIMPARDPGEQVVVGIAGTKGFTVIALEKALMNNEVGFGRVVMEVLARANISYEHVPTGVDTMSVVVSDKQLVDEDGISKLDSVVEDLTNIIKPDVIKVLPGMALIATVGQGMNHAIGTAAKLCTALAEARVNIRMIDQGSSEQNIIIGVEEADLAKAIRAIYDVFA